MCILCTLQLPLGIFSVVNMWFKSFVALRSEPHKGSKEALLYACQITKTMSFNYTFKRTVPEKNYQPEILLSAAAPK